MFLSIFDNLFWVHFLKFIQWFQNESAVHGGAPVTQSTALKAAEPKLKHKTYAQAVLAVIKANGLVSRVSLTKECSALGFDKAAQIKSALHKLITEGRVELDRASYALGAQERPAAGDAYEEALERAVKERDGKDSAKEQGKLRKAERARSEQTVDGKAAENSPPLDEPCAESAVQKQKSSRAATNPVEEPPRRVSSRAGKGGAAPPQESIFVEMARKGMRNSGSADREVGKFYSGTDGMKSARFRC